MIEILSKLVYQKPHYTALDLTTLYRDAFATLKPATNSMVLALWEGYVGQSTISQNNGRLYKHPLNCPYLFQIDAGEVILDILLRDFVELQPEFLKQLSHALRNIKIDQTDERVLKWSIAVRKFQFLGIVK